MQGLKVNNNIAGFSLPIKVRDNEEYRKKVEEVLNRYAEYLKRPAFVSEEGLLETVENNCGMVLQALDDLIAGHISEADEKVAEILKNFTDDPFLVSELDQSYSFRGVAPFSDLQEPGYEKQYAEMLAEELTFYRGRTRKKGSTDKEIAEVEEMLHVPYDLREKAASLRFSAQGLPGLYLGVNTYTCGKECRWDTETEDLYVSAFIPNEKGKKLRILNLTILQSLINGISNRADQHESKRKRQLQNSMLKIFPLVIATSFSVTKNEEEKHHYLLSQSLMRAAGKCGIDGIAYLSMQGEDEFQHPQGVNLAIPANDIFEDRRYSEKCEGFRISKPVKFQRQEEKSAQSYINKIYKRYNEDGIEEEASKLDVDGKYQFYGDTAYAKFDNYLVLQLKEMEKMNEL